MGFIEIHRDYSFPEDAEPHLKGRQLIRTDLIRTIYLDMGMDAIVYVVEPKPGMVLDFVEMFETRELATARLNKVKNILEGE